MISNFQGHNFKSGTMKSNSRYGLRNEHMKYYTSLYISGSDQFENDVGEPEIWETQNNKTFVACNGNDGNTEKIKKEHPHERDIEEQLCSLDNDGCDLSWAIQNPLIFPIASHDLAELPPAFITAGSLDILLDDAKAYHKLLSEFGVKSELHIISDAIHGFMLFSRYDSKPANVLRKIDTFIAGIVQS